MKQLLLSLAVLTFSIAAHGQKVWALDKSHARVGFTVTHGMLSEVDGNFKTFDASIKTTKDDLSDAVIEFSADAASINTDFEMRDNDLKKEDFFNVTAFPKLTFKSTSMTKILGNQYKLVGDLTMKGVTAPVTLDLWLTGPVKNDFMKKNMIGVKAIGKLNRTAFKVGTKLPTFMVGEDVALRFNAEFGMPL